MARPEDLETGRTWRDELPRVESVIHPSLMRYLRHSAIDKFGHLDPGAAIYFADTFLVDFAGHRRIEEMIARMMVRSAVDGIWASIVELNLYSDQSPEGRAEYNAQLIAESYGLLRHINPSERSFDFDPAQALRPTNSLLKGVVSRLNGDMTRKITPESQF